MHCHCNANVAGVHDVQVSCCVLVAKVDYCNEVATLNCPDVNSTVLQSSNCNDSNCSAIMHGIQWQGPLVLALKSLDRSVRHPLSH